MTKTTHTKLQTAVNQLADSQHNTLSNLADMGWTKREVEAAVRRGELTWLADGRIAVHAEDTKDDESIPCAWCNGEGTLDANPDGSGEGEECSHCSGTGHVIDED